MKLTKLELAGFKSFADRTVLHFDSGVTTVVGPNGCGKSNIVDAFKWVLGEQSAKSLRGDEMLDVIFNGSASRKPSGMAEVILTFDNNDHRLAVEQTEVSVGRRLYRDGTSEYILNKQVVRLKDVRELFMDTGIGVDAYSLVEQGKVDQVLATNAVDRREVFEEAAGISRYHARKREAQRKLERVAQNLLRLTDIAGEVDKRLRTIKAAATKARNYQEYSQRLRQLRLSHFLREYHLLAEQLDELGGQVTAASETVTAVADRQAQVESRREELDQAQLRLAGELAEAENRLVEIHSQVSNHQDRIRFAADREKELNEELARRRQAMIVLHARLAELKSQEIALRSSADGLDAAAEAARGRIDSAGLELHALDVQINELGTQAERANDELIDLLRRAANLNNQVHEHRATRQNLAGQQARLAARSTETQKQLSARQAERSESSRQLAAVEADVADARTQLEQARSAAAAKHAAIGDLAARLAMLKERRSSMTGRRDLLASLERKLEGIADGPRELLRRQSQADTENRDSSRPDTQGPAATGPSESADATQSAPPVQAPPRIEGLAGLVADLFIVAPENVPAVQAALGRREQWLVVRRAEALSAESARRLLADLPGEATLLCLDRLGGPAPSRDQWLGRPEVVGCAADLILCEPVYFPVRDYLLADTFLVETLDAAMRLAGEAGDGRAAGAVKFLTRDGHVVCADGQVIVPGARSTAEPGQADDLALVGLLGRKAELRRLGEQLLSLGGEIAELEAELSTASAEAAQLELVIQHARSMLYQQSTEQVRLAGVIRQLDQLIDSAKAEQALLAGEMQDVTARWAEAETAEQAAAEQLAQIELRRQETQRQAEELAGQFQHKQAAAKAMTQALTEAKVALGQLEERRLAARQQLAGLRRGIEEALAQQATARSDIRSFRLRIEQSQQAQLASGNAISELYVQLARLSDDRIGLSRRLNEVRQSLAQADAAARATVHELRQAEEALHALQLRQNELRVRQEDLVRSVGAEHQMDLPQMYRQRQASVAGEGLAIDWAAVEAEIAELRVKIERLGNVNIEAIDEQEQLQVRSTFLNQQLADVLRAKEQLGSLIERINAESSRRFQECFEQVRVHFQELFRKLFGGGKADLVLENPADVLESGIDIIARPPGKQLQSISLMSGGEKTMTATALLLAIFRSKPSPFCILDEVDAALDEANNERFNEIVREFLRFSQFIIITHSKRTMTIADVLYGVTMQEQGVSRQVAVRFDGRSVRGHDGEMLEEPAAAVA